MTTTTYIVRWGENFAISATFATFAAAARFAAVKQGDVYFRTGGAPPRFSRTFRGEARSAWGFDLTAAKRAAAKRAAATDDYTEEF